MRYGLTIGDAVKDRQGIRYKVLGVGEVTVEGNAYEVAEVEVVESHVGKGDVVTLEGTKMLRYAVDLFLEGQEVDVELVVRFRSTVKAAHYDEAREKLISALNESLTWDGDEIAPQPLEEFEMQVLDKVPA